MRQQVGQSFYNRKPAECNLGPPLTLKPDIEHFLGEPTARQENEGGTTSCKSPQWKTMKAG